MRVTGNRLFALVTLVGIALAAPALAADSRVVAEPAVTAVVATPAAVPALGTAAAASCTATNPGPAAVSGVPAWLTTSAGSCCIPECRRDRDCKAACGSLGGQCAQVNSCCTACLCYG